VHISKMGEPLGSIKTQFSELVSGMEHVVQSLEKKKEQPHRRNRKTKT